MRDRRTLQGLPVLAAAVGRRSRSRCLPVPLASAGPSRTAHAPPAARATLTIARDAATTPVPSSFFGISTEYWALPLFERNMPAFERVLSLLHVTGDGPLVLRIGGDSADHSFWSPRLAADAAIGRSS